VLVPLFVVSTMLNVGLTQKPSAFLVYLRDWRFVARMGVANFLLVPLLAIFILRIAPFEPALKAGLLIFALCAGAPFLIKLTQLADHDLALGAATMMLLVVLTVVFVPLVLPLLLEGIAVDAWAVARSLLRQMIMPVIVGIALVSLVPRPARTLQRWVAGIATIMLYAVMATTLVGYFPNMTAILGTGAVGAGLAIVAGAFGIGYLLGGRSDELRDVGGLGTAQRNTAAALTIAAGNFSDPDVLVTVTLVNLLGLVALMLMARFISRDNVGRISTA
jgi:BASS family bile acid:Na+ symporter